MNTSTRRTTHAIEQPIQPPDFSQLASIFSRHFKLKQRAAVGGLLTLVIILSIIAGAVGLVTIQLQSTSFAGLEASGTALKAQQLAKVKAVQADVTAYANADTLAEARQFISPTGLYRETVVGPETIKPDQTRERSVAIKVYKTSTSTTSIFELNTILSNKGDVIVEPSCQIISSNGNPSINLVANANYTKATFLISTKFGINPDASSNRYATYAIHLVDGVKEYPTTNVYNAKSGSKGHYWAFEDYSSLNLTYNYNIPKGSTVATWVTASAWHQSSFITIILSR